MSGLEPIAALGFACNILQIVDLGRQTIDLIKTVYEGGEPGEELDKKAATLKSLKDEVRKHSRPGNKKFEEELLQAAGRCFTAARDLREEVLFLYGEVKQGSLTYTLKVTIKIFWRKRRLDRLKKLLDKAEKQMKTSLLATI